MNKRLRLALLTVALLVLAAAAVVVVRILGADTTLELTIRDAVSGRWVWDMSVHIQDRAIVGYYQSDAGPRTYRFTRLEPGDATLRIEAPGYRDVSLPVTLKRGRNRLSEPVDMLGLGSPDLARFFVFEGLDGGDIVAELRPVSTAGLALTNHPCMDLWVGCMVSVQLKDGTPVAEPVDAGSVRGDVVYRGEVDWTFDPAPETQFRYTVRIAAARTRQDPSAYRVIDYLIVEPNPLAITRAQLGDLMEGIFALDDAERIVAALDEEKDRLRYFVDTSWNVEAPHP
jgi:hypothetical protein